MRGLALVLLPLLAGCSHRLAPFNGSKWLDLDEAPWGTSLQAMEPFYGKYFSGMGFGGGTLTIERSGRWSYRSWGCVVPDFYPVACSGTCRAVGDRLILEKQDAFGFPTGDYVSCRLVRWEDRVYLMDDAEMAEFCRDIDSGWVPDPDGTSMWFYRGPGEDFRPAVPPALPADAPRRPLSKPISGHIVELLGDGRFRADFGTGSGAYAGLEMAAALAPETGWVPLKVVSCEEGTCVLQLGEWFKEFAPGLGAAVRSYRPGERAEH